MGKNGAGFLHDPLRLLAGLSMIVGNLAALRQQNLKRMLGYSAIADPDARLAAAWKVNGVPTHFVVDGAGNIRFRVVGYVTEWGLRARLWWAENFAS